jgi:hypothetical protein
LKRVYYDGILKDLFQRYRPSLLDELTGGVAVRQVLSGEFPLVQERRADLMLLLANRTILHLEFQSGNHRYMAHRMGIYGLLASMKYHRPIRQVVIYLGEKPMRMSRRVKVDRITVEYHLMDIRELDARQVRQYAVPIRSLQPGCAFHNLAQVVSPAAGSGRVAPPVRPVENGV